MTLLLWLWNWNWFHYLTSLVLSNVCDIYLPCFYMNVRRNKVIWYHVFVFISYSFVSQFLVLVCAIHQLTYMCSLIVIMPVLQSLFQLYICLYELSITPEEFHAYKKCLPIHYNYIKEKNSTVLTLPPYIDLCAYSYFSVVESPIILSPITISHVSPSLIILLLIILSPII